MAVQKSRLELAGRPLPSPLPESTFYKRLLSTERVLQHGVQPQRKDIQHRQGGEMVSTSMLAQDTSEGPPVVSGFERVCLDI